MTRRSGERMFAPTRESRTRRSIRGIDLVYYGRPQQLEYDFVVAPGADPSTIKLAFAGVDDATVDARGDLVLQTAGGPLRFQRPVITRPTAHADTVSRAVTCG